MNQGHTKILSFAALLAFLALLAPLDAQGATLNGRVTGTDGQQKALVRVDVRGPQQRVTVTQSDGSFRLELPAGAYNIEIREGNRVAQFSISIPADTAAVTHAFALPW